MRLKKSIIVTLVIVILMSLVAGCGAKEPKERLLDAVENGEQLDLSKPFIATGQINLENFSFEGLNELGVNQTQIEVINQLKGTEIAFEVISDIELEQFQIDVSGNLFNTPFETTIIATSDQFIVDVENLKDLIIKIEAISGESSGIKVEGLKKYLVADVSNDEEFQTTVAELKSALSSYQSIQTMSQDIGAYLIKNLDQKYFANNGDYVVISLNNESIKEIIDQIFAKFEENPEAMVNEIFTLIEEKFYPTAADLAKSQGESVPSKEEFMMELEQGKADILAQANSKESLEMIKNSIDQSYQMLNTFLKINKYEVGYEIDNGAIVGGLESLDIQIQRSAFVPISVELSLTAKSHFENKKETINMPTLNEENSQNANELSF